MPTGMSGKARDENTRMQRLHDELTTYYDAYRLAAQAEWPVENVARRAEILAAMDDYAAVHPDAHPSLLKARLHEEMAERGTIPAGWRWWDWAR